MKKLLYRSAANRSDQRGFALITTLLVLAVLSSLLAAYMVISKIELASMHASKDSATGFFAAEGGLNVRAELIRGIFVGYNVPSGTAPTSTAPCEGANIGSGDLSCIDYTLGKRTAQTYVIDHQAGTTPAMIRIPQGELYQNLNAQEYRYTANSEAFGPDERTEAILQLRFKSRLVPLFQFAVFYNKDLEILPGPAMNLNGPVHVNGDLYLNSNTSLDINGQVSASGSIYRGRKDGTQTPICNSVPVRIMNPTSPLALYPSCSSRILITNNDIQPYNGMVQFGVQAVTVPEPDTLDPTPGKLYWDRADLRLVLNLNSSNNPVTTTVSTGIEVRNSDNSVNVAATNTLFACSGSVRRNPAASDNFQAAVGTSYTFRSNRENKNIRMLDIDLRALLNCLHSSSWFGTGKLLSDSTDGGLVFHFTAQGSNGTSTASPFGVRVRNGGQIYSSVGGAPTVRGLTMVSDQAFYLQGDYNNTNKKPAAVLADSFNVLSNNFWDSTAGNFKDSTTTLAVSSRNATSTTQNCAVLAGTDTTGGQEGGSGQGGAYNGGVENYPRFHENWTGRTYTYRGSFVSLNQPRHVSGGWVYGNPQYTAPNRNWDYDTAFNNAANLPPLSPRFVYLRQELFVRDYDQ